MAAVYLKYLILQDKGKELQQTLLDLMLDPNIGGRIKKILKLALNKNYSNAKILQ